MHWKVESNCISKLYCGGRNIIVPWGIETADSSAFFSLEDGFGYRYQQEEHTIEQSSTSHSQRCVVSMKEGKWELCTRDQIESNTVITRHAILTCLEDSYLMDFVMQFWFR